MSEDVFRWVVASGVLLAALCILVQAIVILVLYGVVKKTLAKVMPIVERTGPIIDTVRNIVDETKPKISAISTDAVQISNRAREQTQKISDFMDDFTARAKAKVARVDNAVDETVDQVQQAGGEVKKAVLKPIREVNGVLSGLRAAIGVYTQGRRASVDQATQNEELFI